MELVNILFGLSVLLCTIALYVLPSILVVALKRTHVAGVIVVNLLLGWTLLGWVAALAWAVSSPLKNPEK